MDSKVKTKIIWGVLALVTGAVTINHISHKQTCEEAERQMKEFRKKHVTPLLKSVNDATAPRPMADASPFVADAFLARMADYEKRTARVRRSAMETYGYLAGKQGQELPENECKMWEAQLGQLKGTLEELDKQQAEARGVYDAQMKAWQAAAAAEAAKGDYAAELSKLEADLEDCRKKAESRRSGVAHDDCDVATRAYNMDIKKLKKRLVLVRQKREEWQQATAKARAARAAMVKDNGEINHDSDQLKQADALLAAILVDPDCPLDGLTAPTILPAPPPPPFIPDIRMVATGDLADSLLEPLVTQWLKAREAQPVEGSAFVWNVVDENTKEIEVKVPDKLQGADAGKLRIRISADQNAAGVFTRLMPGGDADLVLTGRKMNKQQEALWLPQGKSLEMLDPQGKGRAYRTRVCSDALIFFRGNALNIETVSAGVLTSTPRLFDMDDAGRMEAAAIFGQHPGVGDKRVALGGKDLSGINSEHPEHIFMGTWHKDGVNHNPGMALIAQSDSTLGYTTRWDDPAVLKNIPMQYRTTGAGCLPTDDTINSGEYAFSYNITFYRSTTAESKAAAAADLMAYAGDITNHEVGDLVRVQGFAPLQFTLDKPDNTLTDNDLPLALVIRQMENAGLDMGYDETTSTWVYGVRIPIPLYYEVGSVTADGKKAVQIDADSRYYTETQGLQAISRMVQGKKACLVLVGHADPRWSGKNLDTGKESWQKNLALSTERAKGVYKSLFSDLFSGMKNLGSVQLGTSWARPASDLDLTKSVDEQEAELARCRRVDVFLVFPIANE